MIETQSSTNQADLVDAIRGILHSSAEPLTIPRIRERLPDPYRGIRADQLASILERQVAADVLVICPKYRSAQDRFWDRPLREHAKVILHDAIKDGPISWTDIRKKYPKYLRHLAESVLNEELARGAIHRHPQTSPRMGPRYAHEPAKVGCYAKRELQEVLTRLVQCGFTRNEARETLMQLLLAEEWGDDNVAADQ